MCNSVSSNKPLLGVVIVSGLVGVASLAVLGYLISHGGGLKRVVTSDGIALLSGGAVSLVVFCIALNQYSKKTKEKKISSPRPRLPVTASPAASGVNSDQPVQDHRSTQERAGSTPSSPVPTLNLDPRPSTQEPPTRGDHSSPAPIPSLDRRQSTQEPTESSPGEPSKVTINLFLLKEATEADFAQQAPPEAPLEPPPVAHHQVDVAPLLQQLPREQSEPLQRVPSPLPMEMPQVEAPLSQQSPQVQQSEPLQRVPSPIPMEVSKQQVAEAPLPQQPPQVEQPKPLRPVSPSPLLLQIHQEPPPVAHQHVDVATPSQQSPQGQSEPLRRVPSPLPMEAPKQQVAVAPVSQQSVPVEQPKPLRPVSPPPLPAPQVDEDEDWRDFIAVHKPLSRRSVSQIPLDPKLVAKLRELEMLVPALGSAVGDVCVALFAKWNKRSPNQAEAADIRVPFNWDSQTIKDSVPPGPLKVLIDQFPEQLPEAPKTLIVSRDEYLRMIIHAYNMQNFEAVRRLINEEGRQGRFISEVMPLFPRALANLVAEYTEFDAVELSIAPTATKCFNVVGQLILPGINQLLQQKTMEATLAHVAKLAFIFNMTDFYPEKFDVQAHDRLLTKEFMHNHDKVKPAEQVAFLVHHGKETELLSKIKWEKGSPLVRLPVPFLNKVVVVPVIGKGRRITIFNKKVGWKKMGPFMPLIKVFISENPFMKLMFKPLFEILNEPIFGTRQYRKDLLQIFDAHMPKLQQFLLANAQNPDPAQVVHFMIAFLTDLAKAISPKALAR